MVSVVTHVAQPVWHVEQTPGAVTVTVGVVGQFLSVQGTKRVDVFIRMHIGWGGQEVSRGQCTVHGQ